MAAAAPHRERRGSAEFCSLRQRQGPRERHGAVSGEGQLGVRDRVCARGRWDGHSLPEFRTVLSGLDLNFGWCCVESGSGLSDPCGSLPAWDIL